MAKFEITLGGKFVVSKGSRAEGWSVDCEVELDKLPATIIADLALHGLKQKIADAASGAKTPDEASASMGKALDAIMAGEWSSRGSGEGLTEEVRIARQVTRELFKEVVGAKSPEWAEFTGLDAKTQGERLDELFAKNEAKLRPAVEKKIEALKAERARKASLKVDFAL